MTTQPGEPQNIDEVIWYLQSQRPVLTKDKKGQVGNQKTKYADLVQVNDVVLKILNDLHTIWTCRPHLDGGTFGLHYSLRHVPSGTELTGVWPLKLSENPQQMGSATTYGRRYALLAVTGIVAEDEDDDGQAADGRRTAQRATPTRRPEPRETVQRGPRPALPGERPDGITDAQQRKLHASLKERDLGEREAGLRFISQVLDREVTSTRELTRREAGIVIDTLETVTA